MTDQRHLSADITASRREFLKRVGVAGAFAAMGRVTSSAQKPITKMNVRGGAIDVHHHHAPPALNGGRGAATGPRGAAPPARLEVEGGGVTGRPSDLSKRWTSLASA